MQRQNIQKRVSMYALNPNILNLNGARHDGNWYLSYFVIAYNFVVQVLF